MGFLDMFDNPNIMGQLFGIDGGASYDPSMAPRPPGPDIQAPVTGGLDPRMGNVGNPPMPQPRPYIPGQPQANPDILASTGDPRLAPQVPIPQPRPANPAENEALAWSNPGAPLDISANGPGGPGGPGSPSQATTLSARAGAPSMAAPGGMPSGELAMNPPQPLAAAPPAMPPPAAMTNAPPNTSTNGGLAGAFGLTPQQTDAWRAALSGAGKGLSAVAAQRPGATAGASFAAGAGGALQGATAMQQQQKQQDFNNNSTYFKDWLANNESGDKMAINQARAKYFNSIATSIAAGQGRNGVSGSNAWQNTDYGRVITIEKLTNDYQSRQQFMLNNRWKMNGSTPEQQQQDLDQLQKNIDGFRARLYTSAGVDPTKADTIKNMGLSADNPFDVTKFKGTPQQQLEQFHAQVPMGAWFKDQNGVVRQRTVPPPGYNAGPQSSGGGAMPTNPAVSGAIYNAMQPAD